jgi:hypothetical protein
MVQKVERAEAKNRRRLRLSTRDDEAGDGGLGETSKLSLAPANSVCQADLVHERNSGSPAPCHHGNKIDDRHG